MFSCFVGSGGCGILTARAKELSVYKTTRGAWESRGASASLVGTGPPPRSGHQPKGKDGCGCEEHQRARELRTGQEQRDPDGHSCCIQWVSAVTGIVPCQAGRFQVGKGKSAPTCLLRQTADCQGQARSPGGSWDLANPMRDH